MILSWLPSWKRSNCSCNPRPPRLWAGPSARLDLKSPFPLRKKHARFVLLPWVKPVELCLQSRAPQSLGQAIIPADKNMSRFDDSDETFKVVKWFNWQRSAQTWRFSRKFKVRKWKYECWKQEKWVRKRLKILKIQWHGPAQRRGGLGNGKTANTIKKWCKILSDFPLGKHSFWS